MILSHQEDFTVFDTYISEYDRSMSLLEDGCRNNPDFASIVKKFEVKSGQWRGEPDQMEGTPRCVSVYCFSGSRCCVIGTRGSPLAVSYSVSIFVEGKRILVGVSTEQRSNLVFPLALTQQLSASSSPGEVGPSKASRSKLLSLGLTFTLSPHILYPLT